MKSFKNSRLLSFLAVFALLLSLVAPLQSQAIGEKIHYVALGDSLAAGQTPFKTTEGIPTWDKGFSGIIAEHFEKNGILASYSNKFAVSGYTTQNVLDDIVNNKEVAGVKLQDKLKVANYVTITAGANDLLNILKESNIDLESDQISFDVIKKIAAANIQVQDNLKNILTKITALNPKAEIYVSGYYNAFPYLSATQQTAVKSLLSPLNEGIKKEATSNGATFVSMEGIFDASKETYLPNPRDIHPSLEGYQLIANNFINAYNSKVKFQFVDIPESYLYYNEIKFIVDNRIMTGISDTHFGTTKSITRADTAQALFNILPLDKSLPPNPGFTDVPTSHPNYMAIAKLTQAGVFQKADKFNPDAKLTRAQMAKVLTLAFDLKATSTSSFTDVNSKNWAKPYVDALVSAKITTGAGNNTFLPNKETSREHFALFLFRSYNSVLVSTK